MQLLPTQHVKQPPYTCIHHPIGFSWLDISNRGSSRQIKSEGVSISASERSGMLWFSRESWELQAQVLGWRWRPDLNDFWFSVYWRSYKSQSRVYWLILRMTSTSSTTSTFSINTSAIAWQSDEFPDANRKYAGFYGKYTTK